MTEQRVLVPLHAGRGQNEREHFMARARRVKGERDTTGWALRAHERRHRKPHLPCMVRLERQGPTPGLDDDNLVGSLKAVRDAVAEWIGVDDDDPRIHFEYTQARTTDWNVLVVVRGSDA
jgi:hypothetical protein